MQCQHLLSMRAAEGLQQDFPMVIKRVGMINRHLRDGAKARKRDGMVKQRLPDFPEKKRRRVKNQTNKTNQDNFIGLSLSDAEFINEKATGENDRGFFFESVKKLPMADLYRDFLRVN